MTLRGTPPAPRRVSLEIMQAVAVITLVPSGGPCRIGARLAVEFRDACALISSDDAVRAVLLLSAGDDFCTGGLSLEESGGKTARFRVADALAAIREPVTVALHGRTLDQGLELALAGDIRIASDDVRLAMRQAVDGGFPFDGGTQRLPRIAGPGVASEMLFTGREIDAREALAAGIVTEVVSRSELAERARATAGDIASRGALAGRYSKEAVNSGLDMPIEQGLRLEADLSLLLHGTAERDEGLAAFREHRAARMPGAPGTGSDGAV